MKESKGIINDLIENINGNERRNKVKKILDNYEYQVCNHLITKEELYTKMKEIIITLL